MCDDSTVMASFSLQDGTVSRFLLRVDVSPFGGVQLFQPPPSSDSLPGGSSVLAGSPQPSGSDYGAQVACPSRWMPISYVFGFSRRLIVPDGSPQVASPFLFPHPESQGGLLDCILLSLYRPGALRSPPYLSSAGGCIESGRPFSLELWSPSSACGGCGSHSPLPFSWARLSSIEEGYVSLRCWALPSLGLVLQVLVRSLYREFFLRNSRCPLNM